MDAGATEQTTTRVNWRLAITCTVVLTVLFSIQGAVSGPNPPPFATALERQTVVWFSWLAMLPLVVATARRYPFIGAPRKRWLARQLGLATIFALVHSFLLSIVRHLLGIALQDTVLDGAIVSFISQPGRNYLTYAFIATSYHAVEYHRAVRERDLRAARLEVDLAEARLATLENRLRPHFLFNTLNAIAALIRDDPGGAEAMLGQLSELLRASLRSDPGAEIPLDDEIHLVEQYLAIQRVRFQDRLHVGLRVADEARRALVPQLVLQPIVENAVRHGIAPRESGGSVWVTAERPNGTLRLTVEDDGVGMSDRPSPHAGSGIGLGGLRSRLAHLYGAEHRVEVSRRPPTGTRVTIEIPFRLAKNAG